ncbi:hypothetical protein ID866_11435 [Astraeus odoratus]|nr:hypothetical protein ID866_11435 [Astraeus odoratus]
MDQAGQTTRESEQDTIPCVTWDLHEDPHKLPSLPSLPPLIPGRKAGDVYLIKIAGLEHHLVGLTNHGHVLKFHLEDHLSRLSTWEYLPQFSDPDKIKGHVTSVVPQLRLPDDILITHVNQTHLHDMS